MTNRIRSGGWSGIVFVVLVLVTVFSAGQPPDADDSVDKIRTYFVDHRTAMLVANFIGLLAILFVVWFFVVLRDALRSDDGATNALATMSLAGLLITAPMAIAGGAIASAPIYVDGVANQLSDDTLRIIYEAQSLLFAGTSAGIVTLSVAIVLAIRRSRALPAYVMWLALLAVLGNLLTMIATLGAGAAAFGFAGVLTFALFILVTGITMAAGKVTPARA